jgi:hypothetical protein
LRTRRAENQPLPLAGSMLSLAGWPGIFERGLVGGGGLPSWQGAAGMLSAGYVPALWQARACRTCAFLQQVELQKHMHHRGGARAAECASVLARWRPLWGRLCSSAPRGRPDFAVLGRGIAVLSIFTPLCSAACFLAWRVVAALCVNVWRAQCGFRSG